jgi:hypothetical protein
MGASVTWLVMTWVAHSVKMKLINMIVYTPLAGVTASTLQVVQTLQQKANTKKGMVPESALVISTCIAISNVSIVPSDD